jgi:hypothetical protein
MGIARAAPILVLIALSGCSEKLEASDPPAAELVAEPVAGEHSPMPAQTAVASQSSTSRASEAEDAPRMQSPVQLD